MCTVLGKWQDLIEAIAVCRELYQQDDFLVPKMAGNLCRQSLSLKNMGTGPGVTQVQLTWTKNLGPGRVMDISAFIDRQL